MAPFLTSEEQNHKHLFIGMASGSVHIYDIEKRDFTNFTIRNLKTSPNASSVTPFKVTDIKCEPNKMHRVLIAHSKSHVQVYSLNKQTQIQNISFTSEEVNENGSVLACEWIYSES